ncbi:VOC family protein [Streptomyces qinglanensis]|uniref:Catechol 2,3-dioxygenase n=1 Tax=Streptomyces qinglanensis TaxID=943816 RepID=A0A1H9WE55_9ACTN|nr:VOC family protein [Streptomyces qinglanensis]SES32069.1 Catechol 2,3-dioxygenase [Streptomyces qinglanensis]
MNFALPHDHVGITVTPENLEPTVRWYADHLGFTVDRRFAAHGTTFVFLTAGDVRIELLSGASVPGRPPVTDVLASMDPQRLHHFCLAVPDLDEAVSHLSDRGVPLCGGPMEISAVGRRIAFVTDNLGTVIELSGPGTRPSGRED